MIRKWLLPLLACCLLITGCSGLKNIQDLTYIVGIGMDYDVDKKEFTAYLQALNFANVAKQEGSKPTEHIPIFVSSAKGETLNLAVSNLYKKTEPPLFFGHVNTIILSHSIVTNRFKEVVEEIGRNRSLRHTMRVLTTEEEIEDVLNIKALFDYPAVYTVLYKKDSNELYQDEIRPMSLLNFLRDFYEPMGIAKLPSVKIDKNSWKAEKDYPILFIDGYSAFQNQKFMKKIPYDDSVIINWLLEEQISLDRAIEEDGKLVAALRVSSPKMKVKYEEGGNYPRFSIELSARADLLEKIKNIPLKELQTLAEENLKKNVLKLYHDGLDSKVDFLNIGEKWYREHPQHYKQLKKSNKFYLEKDSLKNVTVKVQIFHYNTYKYEERSYGDN